MSRSTQYIGITNRAQAWLDTHFKQVSSGRTASGMFDEEVPLGEWVPKEDCPIRIVAVREAVQCTPWSSGPMIFTCLEIKFQSDAEGDPWSRCFEWWYDPSLACRDEFGRRGDEYDEATGGFWI